ncbi:MAG: DEAD/DEAH box helicase [Firmicutes bacterium]|nr:DEAD/DEAH box helicase [Bacillota bacterium]
MYRADIKLGSWSWSDYHDSPCLILDSHTLWGQTICRVWLPSRDAVVRVPASRLIPLEKAGSVSADHIAYAAAAARVADALTQDVLLAPMGSSVIPLPHQILALSRAIAGDQVRYLLADEVGLGKTIEAGLIMRELKLRGLVKQTLVVAPKGLVNQWVAEMRLHFGEEFKLILPDDLEMLCRISAVSQPNAWQSFSQVVVPMDSVKPMDKRRGWTASQVGARNRELFEDLIWAGWDLVIVDEAHRLAGSTDQVARFKLGRGLSEAAPYLLLLSATPHQGKSDAFHRLVSLVDPQAFPDMESVTRERLQPYVIRTEKRHAIDAEGKPLFMPRRTELVPVSWGERHRAQRFLYEAVTEYVREGYNQAMREKRTYIGFLMILMQRLVVSSTRAIRATLEKRQEVLADPEEQMSLLAFNLNVNEEWADLDGQEQLESLLGAHFTALKNERAEVKLLLEIAARCEQTGPDVKAEALLDWIYRLQAEEGDPELKVLVFTEFVPTQEMLREFLSERGFAVVCLNGSMDMEERQRVQDAFAREARILISTDAGGEGLNLQFCHVVINYDIPWNPMRLEQRIGRVDRIGQKHTVRAVNFILEDSVEHRVREVLEQKLAVILEELGIDKTGDVLDSAQAGRMFDDLYMEAILNPDKVEDSVKAVMAQIEEQIRQAQASVPILGKEQEIDPGEAQRLLTHPLPYWVERMTVSYLKAHGGKVERESRLWNLTWPDGETHSGVVFSGKDAEELPDTLHLTLEEPRVRDLVMRLPRFVPGQPVPAVSLSGIAQEIQGFWSLWQISLQGNSAPETRRRRIMPLFLSDNDRVYIPTARHIWDQLLVVDPVITAVLDAESSKRVFASLKTAAEEYGKPIYEGLMREHETYIAREREKAVYALTARRKAIERIGLAQVRSHRLNLLAQEEQSLQEELERRAQVFPDMVCLLVIRVEGGGRVEGGNHD